MNLKNRNIFTLSSSEGWQFSRSNLILFFAFCIYLSLIIFTSYHHEVWRDEVRALSLARHAQSVPDLFRLLKNEGHPVLWYLILFIGSKVVASGVILPIASITIASAAIFLLFFFSPFRWWQKVLLAFCVIPVYEYSVMCRNYGISMLLMFVFCALYNKWREIPFVIAFVLFLLANTNVHSMVVVCAIIACLAVEEVLFGIGLSHQKLLMRRVLPMCIVSSGICLSVVTIVPDADTIVTGMCHVSMKEIANNFVHSLIKPGKDFCQIFWPFNSVSISVFLILAIIPLLSSPHLIVLYVMSAIGLSNLFGLVYAGGLRHQGVFWIALISIFWVEKLTPKLAQISLANRLKARFPEWIFTFGAVPFLILGVCRGGSYIMCDLTKQLSSTQSLAQFIQHDESLKDAILMGEPDYLLEAIPYYINNRIYIPREQRFGKYIRFTRSNAQALSLGTLLKQGALIKERYHVPVLIAFGHFGLESDAGGLRSFSYGKTFTWNANDRYEWLQSVEKVAEFKHAKGDENFELYKIR